MFTVLSLHQNGGGPMGKLDGKVAVITGATSGMALATSRLFIEEGAYVFVTGPASGEARRGREVHRPGRHRRAGPDNPFIRPVSEPAVSRDPANAAPTPPPAGRSVSRKP